MLIMILDSKLVFQSASEGIALCLKTVIPSLYPFLIISGLITASIPKTCRSQRSFVQKLLGIPSGTFPILLLGFLGGYPSGAQNVYQLYKEKRIRKEDAERMLPICNNAWPAFIFGMMASLFSGKAIPWVLWSIQILSCAFVAVILPKRTCHAVLSGHERSGSIVTALQSATHTMAYICGWVILFRILLVFMEHRLLFLLPPILKILICGFLELTNGFVALNAVSRERIRFIIASLFLSCGGICVFMQTKSVVRELNIKLYCIGKGLHTLISLALSVLVQPFLFQCSAKEYLSSLLILGMIAGFIMICAIVTKKVVAIQEKVLYNGKKSESEVLL